MPTLVLKGVYKARREGRLEYKPRSKDGAVIMPMDGREHFGKGY